MTRIDEARNAVGELFIMGFNGLELEDETSAFISQAGIGGVILFAQNYDSPAQVAELINQVQECRKDLPLWVSVDHEGGRVQRFKKGFTKIPDAATISATNSPKLAFDIADVMAKELKAVGINLNYAPVVDINTNPKNPVIGSRSFGNNEEQVTKMISAIVRGHSVNHVQPCVKHFPGHGDTSVDSHLALPKVETPLNILCEREFRPFVKAFKSRCSMVMTAHILCTDIDPEKPATLSKKILREILRNELRYSKVIISDDLEMKAITDHYGAEAVPVMAIEAGCDLLIYRSEAAARHAYTSVMKALENGNLLPETVLEAANRSRSLKKEVLLPYEPAVITEVAKKVGTAENQAIIDKLTQSS
jgi:beta-N-acetylhexosaminidase